MLIPLTCVLAAALAAGARADALTPRELEELAAQYFEADRDGRRALEAKLGAQDVLTAAQAEAWQPKLLKLARSSGRKADLESTNWFYDEKKKLGKYLVSGKSGKALVLGLHGGGEGEGDATKAMSGLGGALGGAKAIVVYPEVLRKTEYGWGEEDTEKFVLELIEAIKRTRPIDTNRIYLTGHSMGGYGTWTIGGRHADEFAGLAAFAGAATPVFATGDDSGRQVIGIEPGILPNLRNLPLFVYQSLDDPRVQPWSNQFAVKALGELQAAYGGFEFVYEEVADRGHAFPAKGPGPGIEWAMSHVRNPRPERIVWQPFRAWKRMFYWLWWEEPVIGAVLEVAVTGKNAIAVTTEADVAGLSILVDERLFDRAQEIVVTVNGAERFRGVVQDSLSTLLRTAAERNDPELLFPARIDL